MSEEERARWLDRRLHKRQIQSNDIHQVVASAMESGKRFRVSIEYLDTSENRMFQQESDRTITVPSGPPKETD